MSGGGLGATLVVTVAAVWLAIAAALTLVAERRIRRANAILAAAQSSAALLAAAPARPLLVAANGRIEVDATLLRDLGVDNEPTTLDALVGETSGLVGDDVAALKQALDQSRLWRGGIRKPGADCRVAARVRRAGRAGAGALCSGHNIIVA